MQDDLGFFVQILTVRSVKIRKIYYINIGFKTFY